MFASSSLAIGSDFNASIDVGFRNTGLLPLSNGGSSCHELIGGFQTVGVAFVQTMVPGTEKTAAGLGMLATVATGGFGTSQIQGGWNVGLGFGVKSKHAGNKPCRGCDSWGIVGPEAPEYIGDYWKA